MAKSKLLASGPEHSLLLSIEYSSLSTLNIPLVIAAPPPPDPCSHPHYLSLVVASTTIALPKA